MGSRRAVMVAQMVIRACFAIVLVLGIILWTGHADSWRIVHILAGILIVFGLWTVAGIAAARGVLRAVAVLALLWGALTVVFGLTQESVAPGAAHWAVQIAHLVVGLVAVALSEALGARLRRASA